jgi:hypothetical protein
MADPTDAAPPTNGREAQVATFAKSCRHRCNPILIRRNAALEAAVGETSSEVTRVKGRFADKAAISFSGSNGCFLNIATAANSSVCVKRKFAAFSWNAFKCLFVAPSGPSPLSELD